MIKFFKNFFGKKHKQKEINEMLKKEKTPKMELDFEKNFEGHFKKRVKNFNTLIGLVISFEEPLKEDGTIPDMYMALGNVNEHIGAFYNLNSNHILLIKTDKKVHYTPYYFRERDDEYDLEYRSILLNSLGSAIEALTGNASFSITGHPEKTNDATMLLQSYMMVRDDYNTLLETLSKEEEGEIEEYEE